MLSSVTVAAFLVFGYPHYSPYLAPFLKNSFLHQKNQNQQRNSCNNKTEPTLNLQKPTYKTASQIPTLPLQEEDADTAPVEEEATITQPLKERPFSPQVTEVTIPSGRIISTTQFDLDDWTLAEIQHLKDKPTIAKKIQQTKIFTPSASTTLTVVTSRAWSCERILTEGCHSWPISKTPNDQAPFIIGINTGK